MGQAQAAQPKDQTKGQTTLPEAFQATTKYKPEAKEQKTKVQAMSRWIGRTGLPITTIENEEFVEMMDIIDKRLTVPKKTKIGNMIETEYAEERVKFKERLAAVRRVSIGLDIWTKKGLTAAFLAISACYFNVEQKVPEHILLTLKEIAHPHTAVSIKACVDACLEEWGIPQRKVLTVITDNGSNMVAAFKDTPEEIISEEEQSADDEDDPDPESDVDDQW